MMDEARYGELLREFRPRMIDTGEEHERLLNVAETLMEKGESLSEEEHEALALIILVIEAFEAQVRAGDEGEEDDDEDEGEEGGLPPHMALQKLMESHQIELGDIAPVFGNPAMTREVLEGRRPISRGQAKELGRYFRVPPKLFRPD